MSESAEEYPFDAAGLTSEPSQMPEPPKRTPGPSTPRTRSGRRSTVRGNKTPRNTGPVFPAKANSKETYKEGLQGVLQLAAGVTLPFSPADAAAIQGYSEPVSDAVADLAVTDERVGALLDKILNAGPYGALIAAVVPMVAQLAVNHGLLQPGFLGTMHPDQLITAVTGIPPKNGKVDDNAGNETEAASDNVHA